ncbi:hypothetical protein ACFRAO_03140 [Streptomyces sp. NPDC056656]
MVRRKSASVARTPLSPQEHGLAPGSSMPAWSMMRAARVVSPCV